MCVCGVGERRQASGGRKTLSSDTCGRLRLPPLPAYALSLCQSIHACVSASPSLAQTPANPPHLLPPQAQGVGAGREGAVGVCLVIPSHLACLLVMTLHMGFLCPLFPLTHSPFHTLHHAHSPTHPLHQPAPAARKPWPTTRQPPPPPLQPSQKKKRLSAGTTMTT